MMAGRIVAGAALLLVILAAPPVLADPVTAGVEYETWYMARSVCSEWAPEYTEDSFKSTYVCGDTYDTDDDGVYDRASVWASRYECRSTDFGWDCESEYVGGSVPLDDVVIDLDNRAASITTTVAGCAMDLTFTGSQEPAYEWEGEGYWIPFPALEADGIRLYDRYRYQDWGYEAVGLGTACGWDEVAAGPSERGAMGESTYEEGYTYVRVDTAELLS